MGADVVSPTGPKIKYKPEPTPLDPMAQAMMGYGNNYPGYYPLYGNRIPLWANVYGSPGYMQMQMMAAYQRPYPQPKKEEDITNSGREG